MWIYTTNDLLHVYTIITKLYVFLMGLLISPHFAKSMKEESEKMLVVNGNRTQGHCLQPPVLLPLKYDNQTTISTSQSTKLFSLSSFSLIHRI